jgi:hypothetical protein
MADDLDSLELPPPRLPSVSALQAVTLDGFDPAVASPAERASVAALRAELREIEQLARSRGTTIDLLFKRAFAQMGARSLPAGGGVIRFEEGKAGYSVRDEALYAALAAFVTDGVLLQEELLAAIQPTTVYVVSHTKLNALARNRGDAVREVIEAHRTRLEPDPMSGRVIYPKEAA